MVLAERAIAGDAMNCMGIAEPGFAYLALGDMVAAVCFPTFFTNGFRFFFNLDDA
jgi:hypothetical protein